MDTQPKRIDLHIHSAFSSDADHQPAEILQMAATAGIHAIAITDHDSVGGSVAALAAAQEYGIEVIPGVEITTFFQGRELHVLGYFIDVSDAALTSELVRIRGADEARMRQVVTRLQDLGVNVTYEEATSLSPNAVPKCSVVIKAAMSNGRNAALPLFEPYVTGTRSERPYHNFFLDHMRPGGVAYVEPTTPYTTSLAIELIESCLGLPVLAHPGGSLDLRRDVDVLDSLSGALAGVEVYSSYHDREMESFLLDYCRERNLAITAGSDFHGPTVKPAIHIGDIRGNDAKLLDTLRKRRRVAGLWPI